jgi:leader peptidase (prepilin peptidase)/N-methyltransferase
LIRGREGLGVGDAKLLAAAGSWVGVLALPTVVLEAGLLGLASAMLLRMSGRRVHASTALPFGPSLALALWVVRLYGTWRGWRTD